MIILEELRATVAATPKDRCDIGRDGAGDEDGSSVVKLASVVVVRSL